MPFVMETNVKSNADQPWSSQINANLKQLPVLDQSYNMLLSVELAFFYIVFTVYCYIC